MSCRVTRLFEVMGSCFMVFKYFVDLMYTSKHALPIQAAVLDGFGNVGRPDVRRAFKVGNGAGNFQNAGVGPGRKPELINCSFKQSARCLINLAERFQMP